MPDVSLRPYYDAIYLSPHLDDAALSCGGQIFLRTAASQRVLVVTITAGDPPPASVSEYAQSLHDRWALAADAVAARRTEDLAACRRLGADALHWAVPDCIYRLHPVTGQPFYRSDVDIFDRLHPAEQTLVEDLATQLQGLPPAGRIFAPLTADHRVNVEHRGRHVDHQLTRLAAERTLGNDLWYYEDYPYAQEPGALDAILTADAGGWQAEVISLTPVALTAKIEAILEFRSQLSTFWRDRTDLEQQVVAYAAQVGGERVWKRSGRPSKIAS
jgi:LmbE family N-acetylglucosaminyl deacetylase